MKLVRTIEIKVTVFLAVVALLASTPDTTAAGASTQSFLAARPVVREKSNPVMAPAAIEYLKGRDSSASTVWIFFGDKGIRTAAEFDSASSSVVFTERAARRRDRTSASEVRFADLPVHRSYIDQVVALGAVHRRSSRWLNAASFFVPMEVMDRIAAQPFVSEIRPIADFHPPKAIESDMREGPPVQAQSVEAFDYGPSQTQIYQIGVAAAHAQNLSGRGVTLTVTDTGFRKTHQALAPHVTDGRVLAEYDFVMNDGNTSEEPGDPANQWSHGTLCWSVAGGYAPGHVIGPAYNANFILCKTENLASETPVEEDNWVAALEFADSIGTDVISTSLGYSDWYSYADMDGQTAVITQAANTCDALGIVLVVSAGNNGSAAGTISAPADAFNVLAVGAIDAGGRIAAFSSRGPTYDGRIKPEICAMGVDTYGASVSGDQIYRYASGTSLSAPLIAGAVCLMIEARPDLTPAQIRQALQATATLAATPDNDYGWGAANLSQALLWPVYFSADVNSGPAPLDVHFSNSSWLETDDLNWDFGDGASSQEINGAHTYTSPGLYDVSLTLNTTQGTFTRGVPGMVRVHADSMTLDDVHTEPGSRVRVDVYARNFLPITQIEVPFSWTGPLELQYDSFSTEGLRTAYFPTQSLISIATSVQRAAILLRTPGTTSQPALAPGNGSVLSLYFTVPYQPGSASNPITFVSYGSYSPSFQSGGFEYNPSISQGSVSLGCCDGVIGDVNGDGEDIPTLSDVATLIDHIFITGVALPCLAEADVNQSGGTLVSSADLSIGDVALLIDYLFISGTSSPLPPCL